MTKLEKSLYINIANILSFSDGQSEQTSLCQNINSFEFPGLMLDNNANISGFIKATKIKNQILLAITGDFKTTICCTRCLKPVKFYSPFVAEVIASFFPKEDELKIDGDEIDIYPFLEHTVILALPSKVLCQNSCRGLCPVCGIDRNQQQCKCKNESITNSFDKLKTLKVKNHGGTKEKK